MTGMERPSRWMNRANVVHGLDVRMIPGAVHGLNAGDRLNLKKYSSNFRL